jgi:hypothetical protein
MLGIWHKVLGNRSEQEDLPPEIKILIRELKLMTPLI